jgi:hypothetical protein
MNEPCLTPTIEEARALLFASDPKERWTMELLAAANAIIRACENPEKVSFDDMLRCLDFPGVTAEIGARCLYVRTGRDGVGWKPAPTDGVPFSTSKEDWLGYLRSRKLIAIEKPA